MVIDKAASSELLKSLNVDDEDDEEEVRDNDGVDDEAVDLNLNMTYERCDYGRKHVDFAFGSGWRR